MAALKTNDGALLAALLAASAGTYGLFKSYADGFLKKALLRLNDRGIQIALGALIISMGIVNACTSSAYVALEEGSASNGDRSYSLTVQKNQEDIETNFSLSPKQPYYFYPPWFRTPETLEFILLKPVGFAIETRDLGWGDSVRLTIPRDFSPKEYRFIRLVPSWGLLDVLSPKTQADDSGLAGPCRNGYSSSTLVIKVYRENKLLEPPYCISPLYLQPIYTGASAPELELIAAREESREWIRDLEVGIQKSEVIAARLQELATSTPLYLETVEFMPGDRIDLSYVHIDEEGTDPPYEFGSWDLSAHRKSITAFLNRSHEP